MLTLQPKPEHQSGRETMIFKLNSVNIFAQLLLLLGLLALPPVSAEQLGDLELSTHCLDSTLTIRTEARFAGAISSLVFRGKEFVNSDDNGREIQSSVFLDEYGACDNPTEAGTTYDRGGKTSSDLLTASVEGKSLITKVRMAYWLYPNQPFSKGRCGLHPLNHARNQKVLSDDILNKKLNVGFNDLSNVIDYNVTFEMSGTHDTALFEAVTGYMPKEFNKHLAYDFDTKSVVSPKTIKGSQELPLIFATNDDRFAMGIYSPDIPFGVKGYGHASFEHTEKWNCNFPRRDITGKYSFRCFIVIGTVDEVAKTMQSLFEQTGMSRKQ